MSTEFYELIGVDRGASGARIRQAYGQAVSRLARRRRALVEQGGDTASIDLQRTRMDEAWTVLQDPLRRRRYDAMLAWTESAPSKASSGGHRSAEALWTEVSDALVHPAAALAAKLLRVTSKLSEIGQLPLAPSGAAEEPPTLVPHDDDLTSPRAARLGRAPGALAVPPRTPGSVDGSRERAPGTLPPEAWIPTPTPAAAPTASATPARATPAPATDTTGARFVMPRPKLQRPPNPTTHPSSFKVVDGAPEASDILVLPSGRTSGAGPVDRIQAPTERSPSSTRPAAIASGAVPMASRPPAALPRVPPLPPDAVSALVDQVGYGGTLLSTVRERLGLSVRDLADHTRISVRYLEALESEARDQLPSATFVRGYVREVARVLQLDADAVVSGYMRRYEGQ